MYATSSWPIEERLKNKYPNAGRFPEIAEAANTIADLRKKVMVAERKLEEANGKIAALSTEVERLSPAIIQYASEVNPWIDCLVFVPRRYVNATFDAMRKAYDSFWDYQFETYGDALERELIGAKIPYEIQYGETTGGDEDTTTKEWDAYVASLDLCGTFISGRESRKKEGA